MNETTPPAINPVLPFTKKNVLEWAIQLATANNLPLKDAASQLIDVIALLNGRSQATDEPR